MKKIISLLLVTMMCVSLCACGNSSGSSAEKYVIGDSVETVTAKLKLNNATFAIALNNKSGDDYLEPKEYTAEDSINPYVANDGAVLVYYDVTLSAIGRSDIDIANSKIATVKYDGKTYKPESGSDYSGNSKGSTNVLIRSGKTQRVKGYFEIPINAELNDSFEITFLLPNGTDKVEKFTFTVDGNYDYERENAKAIETVKALDTAEYCLGFAYEYAGHSANGSLKFSDDILVPLSTCLNDLDEAYIEENFPKTMEKLPVLKESIEKVCTLLTEMGETNSDKNVAEIKQLASETNSIIYELLDEFVDYK